MTLQMYYILDGHTPIAVDDVLEWARWFEENIDARRVTRTEFANGSYVSTVFIGIDHAFGSGPPLLFETMVFGGRADGWQDRYSTWEEAEVGHAEFVTRNA